MGDFIPELAPDGDDTPPLTSDGRRRNSTDVTFPLTSDGDVVQGRQSLVEASWHHEKKQTVVI